MQYFNPQISKLESLNRVFSTVCVLILEQLLVSKRTAMSSSFYIDSFLSLDILLTGYEQLSYDNSIEIYQFVSLAED